jgi:ubiquinone/menaquinone biosynthesis C-methylase UbiE
MRSRYFAPRRAVPRGSTIVYDGHSKYDESQAQTYDAAREGEEHWHEEAAFVTAHLRQSGAIRVLDVPVGTGRLLSCFDGASSICGVDISSDMLTVAGERVARERLTNVALFHGSIFSLPFETKAFDVAVCCRLLHLLPPDLLAGALRELGRVTSGDVLVQAYVRGNAVQRLVERVGGFPGRLWRRLNRTTARKYPWAHIRAYFHDDRTFRAAIADAGLAVTRRVDLSTYRGHDVCFFVLRNAS